MAARFVCTAVIGKDNAPLFIKSMTESDDLRCHFVLHAALDVVDEKRT